MKTVYAVFKCYADGDGWNDYYLVALCSNRDLALTFVDGCLLEYHSREEVEYQSARYFEALNGNYYLIEEIKVV